MVEHLAKEKEAEARQEAFNKITPQQGETITPNYKEGELVIEQEESEAIEDWKNDEPLTEAE